MNAMSVHDGDKLCRVSAVVTGAGPLGKVLIDAESVRWLGFTFKLLYTSVYKKFLSIAMDNAFCLWSTANVLLYLQKGQSFNHK